MDNAELEDIRRRVRWLSEQHEREWKTAARARDAWNAELNALVAEVELLTARLARLEHMVDEQRITALLGDELTQSVDAFVTATQALVHPAQQQQIAPFARALGTLLAVALGRATQQSASAIVLFHDRLEALERAVGERHDGDQ